MSIQVTYKDLGLIEYKEAWDFQEKLLQEVVENKMQSASVGYLLFCEHPHVYTLGKSGAQENMLLNSTQLKGINASFFHTNRGGDITYHGPGQIVGYPVVNLENLKLSIRDYIHNIEELIIITLKDYDITAERLEGATGVWIDPQNAKARKICAIGVRVSRSVTMHGFAFNINTDLKYFDYINPCGFTNKGVTSLEKETGCKHNLNDVKNKLKFNFAKLFDVEFIN